MVAERALGRGRRGRLDQLVHQARGRPARGRRGRQGQGLQAGPRDNAKMPLFGTRQFIMRIPGTPTGGPFGGNKIVWHDEFVSTEIGQVGTQFDGLGHIGVQIGPDGERTTCASTTARSSRTFNRYGPEPRSRSTERRRATASGAASVGARPFSMCRRARRARPGSDRRAAARRPASRPAPRFDRREPAPASPR